MIDLSRFTIRSFRPGDEAALLDLHVRSFEGHSARTPEQWRWKFAENPLRRTDIELACAADGEIVAAYCGVTHRALLRGEECLAGVQVDVSVARRLRRTPSGVEILAAIGRRYYDRHGGGATRIAWGFPEPALHRIGLRHIDFEVLRDVNFVVRETGAALWPPPASIVVERVRRFGPAADALWARVRGRFGAVLIRDARYLDWRYADQPGLEHVLLLARSADGGEPRGLAVAREGGWTGELLSVLDWLVPEDDRDAEAALVAGVLEEAAARGRTHVAAWFAGAPMLFSRFQRDHGFFVLPTPYQECFRTWVPSANRRWLAQHWYQAMGDIDFF